VSQLLDFELSFAPTSTKTAFGGFQTAIAEDLGMKPANVSRAIKRLVERGAVILGPPTGAHKAYRLSPEWVWRGRTENHVRALDEHRMGEALDGDQADREAMRDWGA
jgi:DNA-binding MarR family transcriptional regulator